MPLEGYKVVTAKEMAQIEKVSIGEGASAEQYMQTAGLGIAKIVENYTHLFKLKKKVVLLVGQGNNGGDAYVTGMSLMENGFEVTAYQFCPLDEATSLCQSKGKQFLECGGNILLPTSIDAVHLISDGVILDGIFGTGFKGEIEGLIKEVIIDVNAQNFHLLSIDIPSGLDGNTGEVTGEAMMARATIYLGLPKLGFFLREGMNHVGFLQYCDFGMDVEYIHQIKPSCHLVNEHALLNLLPKLVHNRHKYEAGYVLAIAGSPGMPGAAMLACLSAMRSGAGIVRLFYPKGMEGELSNEFYELLKSARSEKSILIEAKRAKSVLIGPGLGQEKEVSVLLKSVTPKLTIPCVLDADGLLLLKDELSSLKQPIIITPHRGEMAKLLDVEKFPGKDFIKTCQLYVDINHVTLLLKGSPTFIFHPNSSPIVVNKGDPGMATAGTGDVLTGILASLLAQGLPTREAATLGAYLHGLAGELASSMLTPYHMIARDLIKALPLAITQLLQ